MNERIQNFLLQAQRSVKEVIVTSSATKTTHKMTVGERILKIVLSSGNNLKVYLPPVAEAAGMTFSIHVLTDGGAAAHFVDAGDASTAISAAIADVGDHAIYTSDGYYWNQVSSAGLA